MESFHDTIIGQTSKSKLKRLDLRGLEQNPNTKSWWAKLAREGKAVMQFLEHGRYIAVVVDGKVHLYMSSLGEDQVLVSRQAPDLRG